MGTAPPDRIATLDLIRGVAVLGILAVNIATFANVSSAAFSPNVPLPGSRADGWAFAATLVLFEGKMRALFTLLFGASLLLFIDRAEAAGRDGAGLQVRRLGWLALAGYLHFLLLWDGDILFVYAVAGLAALPLRRADPWPMAATALLLFTAWQVHGTLRWLPAASTEWAVMAGSADAATKQAHARALADRRSHNAQALAAMRAGLAEQVGTRLRDDPAYPLKLVIAVIGESLAYTLIGMVLLRTGFFAGRWPERRLWLVAGLGLGTGGAVTLAFSGWALAHRFPEMTMHLALTYALGFPHLLMALGYAALLVLAAPRLLSTRPGTWLAAAGRMALSNYLGTTLLMTALFSGWGLGLAGTVPPAGQMWFVGLGWTVMLAASVLWLARFRQGPLEWAWRSLTERRRLPLR